MLEIGGVCQRKFSSVTISRICLGTFRPSQLRSGPICLSQLLNNERGQNQNPSNCISVWFSQPLKQKCLYKIIPSHSCFTYSRGSVSAKYSPVTFDTVQLLPRSYITVFDESKFYLPRRTAISRAAGGGGAIYIKLVNLRSRYK